MSERAVLDARLAFNIIDGFAITFAFATKNELKQWRKMQIPRKTESLVRRIADMESRTIGVNFAFEDSA